MFPFTFLILPMILSSIVCLLACFLLQFLVKEDPAWMKFFTGVQLRYLSKPVIAGVN